MRLPVTITSSSVFCRIDVVPIQVKEFLHDVLDQAEAKTQGFVNVQLISVTPIQNVHDPAIGELLHELALSTLHPSNQE